MNCTRPDIAQAVNTLCKYGSRPGPDQLSALKGVLRCLLGTQRLGITYSAVDSSIQGWCDADYAGDIKSRNSTTGYATSLATMELYLGPPSSNPLWNSPQLRLSLWLQELPPRMPYSGGRHWQTTPFPRIPSPSSLTISLPLPLSRMGPLPRPPSTLLSSVMQLMMLWWTRRCHLTTPPHKSWQRTT
jgi:hypothetical protein